MDTEVYKKSQEFLQTEGMQKIMVSTDFYFQKARDAFYKFMEYDNRRLIEEIIDWTYNKQRYSDRNDVQELLTRRNLTNMMTKGYWQDLISGRMHG